MSEEENKEQPAEAEHSELDLAIESLLTDLKSQSPPEATDASEELSPEIPSPQAEIQDAAISTEVTTSSEAVSTQNSEILEDAPTESISTKETTEKESSETVEAISAPKTVKKKRWPWILVGLLIALGGAAGFYYWKVLRKAPHTFALTPPNAPPSVADQKDGLLSMDAPLFASESLVIEDSTSQKETNKDKVDSLKSPPQVHADTSKPKQEKQEKPPIAAHGTPDAHSKTPPITANVHEKAPSPVETKTPSGHGAAKTAVPEVVAPTVPTVKAMDSLRMASIQGRMAEGRVGYRTDVVLYMRKKVRRAYTAGQLESIRVVIQNIFYFTEPRKDQIPEIEQQILQKAGFLLPDGQIFLVSLQNLTMEIPP